MTNRTVTVDATARQKKHPEVATVEIDVNAEAVEASAALAKVRDRVDTVHDAASSVSTNQVQTVDLRVKDTAETFGSSGNPRYQATARLHIDCAADGVETVVTNVTDAGGTVETVQFQIHDQHRQQIQNKVLSAAMRRAREKASQVTAAEDLTVGDVRNISTQDVDDAAGMGQIATEVLYSPTTDLAPSPVTIIERIEVTYCLTEKE